MSVAPGLILASPSLQSVLLATYPAGAEQAGREVNGSPKPSLSASA